MERKDTHDARARRATVRDRCASRGIRRRSPSTALVLALALALVAQLASGCTDATRAWRASMRGARHYAAGSEALERGDAPTAIVELREAARLVPHASEIRNHLGIAYWRVGELARAGVAFETAIELDCDNAAARRNLARLDALRAAAAETEAGAGAVAGSGDG